MKNRTVYEVASNFMPIDLMFRDDAEIYIFFLLGNGVSYANPTTDDWYRVDPKVYMKKNEGAPGSYTRDIPVHRPLEPASPLGCIDQYQFCNTALPEATRCGPLASKRDAIATVASLFHSTYANLTDRVATTETEARYVYFMENFFGNDRSVLGTTLRLGPSSLYSQRHLYNGIQGPLASEQWKLDVTHWWNISKAAMQGALLDMAYGPRDAAILQSHINFTSQHLQTLCQSQV